MKTSKTTSNFGSGNLLDSKDSDSAASSVSTPGNHELGTGSLDLSGHMVRASDFAAVVSDGREPVVGISTEVVVQDQIDALDPGVGSQGGESQGGGSAENVASGGLEWVEITHDTVVQGCQCSFCMGGGKGGGNGDAPSGDDPTGANPTGVNVGELLTMGTNPDGSHYFSGNRNVDATLIGSRWGITDLTFSFPTSGTNYNGGNYDTNGVSLLHVDLGPQQQAAARAAFAMLAAATGLTFTEITDTDTVHANIRVSQSADNDVGSAYGNFPSDTRGMAGDIWFGRTSQPYYDLAYTGTWGFATMMHEIGHTMGLKHGHQDYTNSDLSFYFGTTPRFGSQSLTPDRDGQAWSLMTYTPAPFTNSNFAGDKINQPQTYMQFDLAALQYMYGANFNTNSGDTVYTFSQTTGEMFVNGVGQGTPAGNRILRTLWDGNGNDTIDASNYANGVTIDLRPGEFSTLDPAQLANHLAAQGLTALAPGNIAMSLLYNNDVRSLIENAIGGTGNDTFVGNIANNILDGGAGGSDTVVFTGSSGISVTLNDTNTDVIVNHDGETDILRSIENVVGTSGADTLIGNSQNNAFYGGLGGADNMTGGAGDDQLVGGSFTVLTTFDPGTPTSQPDITKASGTNNGSIGTAVNTAGFYDIDANANITSATTIPHATVNATAFGGVLEYYRIDVTGAGAQAIFDIDGTGSLTDSIIELVDAAGNLLATNDTGPAGVGSDPGSTVNDDSYISYTFAAAGTYYIRVGRWTSTTGAVAQPLTAGMTYTLHISVQGAAGATNFALNNTSSLVADGGIGNDLLVGTVASDTLTGGADNDTASFVNAYNPGSSVGVTVDLNLQGAAQNTVAAGSDTLSGIENLIGSALNDTLTGDGNNNVLEGGLGNDTLAGGLGNDTASYAGATAGVTVSLGSQGGAQSTGSAGTDTLSGFENLLGSAFNDTLTGDTFVNTLSGGAGDDTLLTGGTNAPGDVDLLDGGIGTDTASFSGYSSSITATLNGLTDGTVINGGNLIANLRSIENLTGGSGNDTLTGDSNDNVIEGSFGDDTLEGGLGNDTVRFTGGTSVTLNLATLTAQATGWGNDTITGFENVRTAAGADNITGDGNNNIFYDRGGNDSYSGAGGTDTVDYSASTSSLTVNLNTATANRGTFAGTDTLNSIENIVGAATFANTLTGDANANRFTGGTAADTFLGNNGNDVMYGGAGADFIVGGSNAALDDGSSDTLYGEAGNDYLSGGQGNDFLYGGDGDDTLNGTIGQTTGGFFANDGGDDSFDGGDGTDIAIMAYENRAIAGIGVAFDLGNLAGNSNITINGVVTGTLTSIERVTFRGTAADDSVRGGGTLDTLTGNAGNDTLDGWYGNDVLDGGLGDDTIIGGEGLDTATYALATSAVTLDLRLSTAQNTGGYGVDTVTGVEYVIASAFGDTIHGNDEFNLIIDNVVTGTATALSQTDSIFGYGGNDTIHVTRAAAAVATNINIDGGDGDDYLELRSGTLNGTLAALPNGLSTTATGGAALTYAPLGATSNDRNLDVVTLDAGAGDDRIVLTGVASATVNTGSGADTLSISMRGATSVNNYLITLGTGADIIQLGGTSAEVATTARTNRVTDFDRGNSGDKFEMTTYLAGGLLAGSGYVAANGAFASGHMRLLQSGTDLLLQVDRDGAGVTNGFVTIFALTGGYTGAFTAFNFDGFIGNLTLSGQGSLDETITGATGNDILSGNDGNDVLIGLAGTDTLDGGNGDDILRGGAGDDSLIGGANIDTADYSDATGDVNVSLSIVIAQATGGAGTDTLDGIENLTGGNFNDTLTGNAGVNVLNGGGGNDILDAGAGADTMTGGSGNDTYYVSEAGDTVTELFNEGTDTVYAGFNYTLGANVENLFLQGTARKGIGNGLDNVITGNAVANSLDGGVGNDTLDGGVGADTMVGGTGDDKFYVDDAGDAVYEYLDEGTDTVYSSINYTLVANLENLVLTGTARKGIGNGLANVITGNASANVIDAGAGADVLNGLGGNDKLTGGDGADRFVFSAATGEDTVVDFVSGTDKLDLIAYGFADFAAVLAATTDVGGNAVIDLGGGNSITLTGVLESQLQAGDMILAPAGAIVEPPSVQDSLVGKDALILVGGDDQVATNVGTEDVQGWFVTEDISLAETNAVTAGNFMHRTPLFQLQVSDYFI